MKLFRTLIGALLLSTALAAAQPQSAPQEPPTDSLATRVDSGITAWEQNTERAEPALTLLQALAQAGDQNRRMQYARQILQQTLLDPSEEAEVLRHLVESANSLADWSDSTALDARIKTVLEQVENPALRSTLNSAHAAYLVLQGRFADAEQAARRAIDDADGQSAEVRFKQFNSLGVALAQQGRFDDAFEAFVSALHIREQGGLPDSAMLLQNLGGLSIYLGRHEAAIEYNLRALDLLDANAPVIPSVLSNIAASEVELGRFDAARQRLEDAISMGERLGQPPISAIGNLGYVLRELGQPEQALQQFQRQLELEQARTSPGSKAVAWKNIGETLALLDRREEADQALRRALELYHEADIKPKRLELYPVMIDNLSALGEHQKALELMRKFKRLNDEIVSADSAVRIATLEAGLELERQQRELALAEGERLRAEAELGELRAEQTRERGFRSLLLAIILGAALILLLLWRSVRIRGQANRLLAEKNVEIDRQHTALAELNRTLERRSLEDELTGLNNRRFMRHHVEGYSDTTAGDIDRRGVSNYLMLLIDLDHFKQINDQFGHPAGDLVLKRVGDALRECAAASDLLLRWGGEEFLWLCAESSTEQTQSRCVALSQALSKQPLQLEGRAIGLGFSVGATSLSLTQDNPRQALERAIRIADAALYQAKDAGRGRFVCLEPDPVARANPGLLDQTLDISELVTTGRLRRSMGRSDSPATN